jgi:hypothetical protein
MNDKDFGGVAPPRVYKVPVKEKQNVAVDEGDDSDGSSGSASSSREDSASEDTELDELCDFALALAPERLESESEVVSESESEPENNGMYCYLLQCITATVLMTGMIIRPPQA